MSKEYVGMVSAITAWTALGVLVINPYLSLLTSIGGLVWILYWINKDRRSES